MPELAKEALQWISYLLPGLLAAWVFYGLTSHPKPPQFERIVQALIFTFIIQTLIPFAAATLIWVGGWFVIASWNDAAEDLAALLLALSLGVALAYLTNKDSVHGWFRKLGLTTRTSHPSEWYCVFADKITYVVLNLCDGRRLYGWPKEWPVEPDKGQFYVMHPCWIQEDGGLLDLPELEGILINAKDVQWVEFMNKEIIYE